MRSGRYTLRGLRCCMAELEACQPTNEPRSAVGGCTIHSVSKGWFAFETPADDSRLNARRWCWRIADVGRVQNTGSPAIRRAPVPQLPGRRKNSGILELRRANVTAQESVAAVAAIATTAVRGARNA